MVLTMISRGAPQDRLFQYDQDFHLGIDDLTGGMHGNLPREHDGVPQRPSLIEAEVLIVQLHRDGRGRNRGMP